MSKKPSVQTLKINSTAPKAGKGDKSPRKPASNPFDTNAPSSSRKGVQDFGSFMPEPSHVQLKDYDGRSIYIVKMEIKPSDQYGDGYLLHFKDFPNSADTQTAGVYGQYPKAQLDQLWQATNKGERISLDSPVGARIEKIGNSYKFCPLG